ncbi:MAG: strawberry notch family protein [Deltaproteobacteria bacterium]
MDPSRAGKQEGDKPVVENSTQEGGGISRTGEPLLPPTGAVGSGERTTGHRDQATPEGVAGEAGVSLESDGRNGDVGDGGRGRDNGSDGIRENGHERSNRGSDPDIGSTGQSSDGTNGQLSTSTEELQIEAAKKEASGETVEGSLYEGYSPEKITIKGAKKHPTPLVQSAAMASVSPPTPTYRPSIPITSITSGKISDIKIEAVVYAGQAHGDILPSGDRKGLYFIGVCVFVADTSHTVGIMM